MEEVSKGELLKILNDELSKHEECMGCHFDSVLPHDPDAEGRNWGDPPTLTLTCADQPLDPCRSIAAEIVAKMRLKYKLIN